MNIHFIKDKENSNYLTRTNKWTHLMYKAQIFTSIGTARAKKSVISKKHNKKLSLETYELTYLGDN